MRTNFKTIPILILTVITLCSCSKEKPTDLSAEFETFAEIEETEVNYLNKSTTTVCAKDRSLLEQAYAGVYINYERNKTLASIVYQNFESVTIEATYYIGANLDNLPAKITIAFEDEIISFDKVNPGQTVSHNFGLPVGWQPNDEISYQVDQKVYLNPISIASSVRLLPLCDLTPGEDAFGGTIAYIYKEGDAGYVAGEVHGFVFKEATIQIYKWNDAMNYASNYSYGGYDDWDLPTKEQVENAEYLNVGGSGNEYTWTSTEFSESQAYVYISDFRGLQIEPFPKTFNGDVILAREF